MIEERIEDAQQHVARFWDSGSMQNRKDPKVRHGRQNSQLSDILGPCQKRVHKEPAAAITEAAAALRHRAGEH